MPQPQNGLRWLPRESSSPDFLLQQKTKLLDEHHQKIDSSKNSRTVTKKKKNLQFPRVGERGRVNPEIERTAGKGNDRRSMDERLR